MTQCTFKRVDAPNITTTSWIETRGAKLGLKITFRGNKDIWWEVTSIGAVLPEYVAQENENDYKRTREASDI